MKKGRNAPCPCGSGKKYKKCCLGQKQQPLQASIIPADMSANMKQPPQTASNVIRPYVITKMCEPDSSNMILNQMKALKKRLSNMHLPSTIRPLPTNKIIQELSERKVNFDEALFIEQSRKYDSAWDLAEALWPAQSKSTKNVSDFCCLAACILWERYYEEKKINKPSIEMIDDYIEFGYKAKSDSDIYNYWIQAWDALKSLFDFSKHSFQQLDNMFNGSQSLFNWISDYELFFLNASNSNKEYAQKGIVLLNEYISFFGKENQEMTKAFQRSLSEIYCHAGEFEKGEQLIQEVVASYPEDAGSYIAMETLIKLKPSVDKESHLKQRLKILMDAKNYPVINGPDFDLDERIKDVQEELQELQ